MDKNARPLPKDMKLWVDAIQFVKRGATGGALGFFTYMELSESFFVIFERVLTTFSDLVIAVPRV